MIIYCSNIIRSAVITKIQVPNGVCVNNNDDYLDDITPTKHIQNRQGTKTMVMKENDIKNLNFMTQTNETQDVLKRKNCKKGNLSFLNEKNSLACVSLLCQLNWFWQSAHTPF